MQHRVSEEQSHKLTDWANEPPIATLKEDLEMSKQSHDAQMIRIQHWNDLMFVKGKAKPAKVKGRSSVQPKLIRRQAEWRYSALTEPFLGSTKLFQVRATTFEDEEGAKQNEMVLNWQFRTKINKVKLIDDLVRATVDEGTSIVRVGWKRVTVPIKEQVPVYTHYAITTEEESAALMEALELQEANNRAYEETTPPEIKAAVDYYKETQEPTTAVQTGTETVSTEKVIENRPTYEVLNPNNFYIDPSCGGDIDKAMFALVTFETSKADLLKEATRYKNLDQVDWEGATPQSQPDHSSTTPDTFQFRDVLRKKIVAYEYWGYYDIHGNDTLVPIVATWVGNTLIRMELNPYPDQKLPFVMIPYLPVKRELYGEPDAELLEDNQNILGAVARGMIDLLGRSANGQQGFAKGMLDPLNRRRFENGQDYEFNPNANPSQGLIEHKYPETPQSAFNMLSLQNQEAEALTGVKSFGGGMSGDTYGDVATGIRGVLDAASKREMAILRRIAKGVSDIGSKTSSMNAAFLSEKEVIRVTNEVFVTINREDLKGNFDFEVDISTAEIDNAKAQDLAFMLQTIGNNMDIGITLMILAEIATLKRMPALAKKLLTFKPQVTPEQQKLQELEIERAQAEVDKLKSEIRLNDAKAAEARTNKDKKDLDYVEQETGTTHARELQKQQAQARGNQNLQITKALTAPSKEGEKSPDVEAAIGFNEISEELGKSPPIGAVDNLQQRDDLGVMDPLIPSEVNPFEAQTVEF